MNSLLCHAGRVCRDMSDWSKGLFVQSAHRDSVGRQIRNEGRRQHPKKEDFEYEYRERMILDPELWRIGRSDLPEADNFEGALA